MTDLRSRVEDDRGLLKKIELLIPGFKGYRQKEDIRIADNLLRQQLADRMGEVNLIFENSRQELSRNMELALISDIGNILKLSRLAENKIRHAEQGYTGISANFRIEEAELNAMYEWDLALIQTIDSIKNMAGELLDSIITSDDSVARKMVNIHKTLQEFISIFNKRITIIAGLEVS
ncbi:MAG TPA: hypothetical protein VMW53_03630 [archaeon]|nr:hypothetical protein [archaeon]